MNPFMIVDLSSETLFISMGNVTKKISLSKISEEEDFLFEFFKRYKNINFVSKYTELDKKDAKKLLSDLEDKFSPNNQVAIVPEINPTVEAPIQAQPVALPAIESSLIRCASERRIYIEDLDLRFDSPAAFHDLANLDRVKVANSNQLKFFLESGMIVRTNYDEIRELTEKYQAQISVKSGLEVHDSSDSLISGSEADGVETINVESGGRPSVNLAKEVDIPDGVSASGSDVADLFSEMFDDMSSGGDSMDKLLQNT